MNEIKVELGKRSYNIYIGNGIINNAAELFDLNRRAIIVTDSGVPSIYYEKIASMCRDAEIFCFKSGEDSKSLKTLEDILSTMMNKRLQRKDLVIAVGGGVVGDISGFAASCYMRGIDFYNVPTTLLSQVDSSIGGKCAVNFKGTKNIIGSFYQPKGVLIDIDTIKSLDKRQFSSGSAEIIKEAVTFNEELFLKIEKEGITEENLEYMICESLKIKKHVIEKDELESGIRKALNFGHTFGHGVEALGGRLHGECVALGMIPMCSYDVKKRLIPVLKNAGLPTEFNGNTEDAFNFMDHDKKGDGSSVDAVFTDMIGTYKIENIPFDKLKLHIKNNI